MPLMIPALAFSDVLFADSFPLSQSQDMSRTREFHEDLYFQSFDLKPSSLTTSSSSGTTASDAYPCRYTWTGAMRSWAWLDGASAYPFIFNASTAANVLDASSPSTAGTSNTLTPGGMQLQPQLQRNLERLRQRLVEAEAEKRELREACRLSQDDIHLVNSLLDEVLDMALVNDAYEKLSQAAEKLAAVGKRLR
ncbi:hypothetical protein B0T25DRAFT_563209 [Lasiosphaeria hispida]|uniref:Uncharacterized protein n=1 Tax=Lasiosphaeria hispida TaxID=260671 RepID=A0AAJ0HWG8_9PEZI|nr:hypothetical protein B0T25DRAFT_563209 [Lasiosphaeria hispida]